MNVSPQPGMNRVSTVSLAMSYGRRGWIVAEYVHVRAVRVAVARDGTLVAL